MPDEDLKTGAWANDQQAIADTPLSGRGNDADVSNLLRFRRGVMGVVCERERRPQAEYDQLAVFFLATAAWFEHAPASAKRNPLLNTGNFRLTGQIHGVSVAVAGCSMPFTGGVEDLLPSLEALGAEAMPTIVYSPNKGFSTLSWFPKGLADEADVEVINLDGIEPTPDSITQAIDSIYEGHLITPDQVPKNEDVWEDSSKGWAHEYAEARVQSAVRKGLLGKFPPPIRIEAEQPGKDGRTDIEILEDSRNTPGHICHAVLELKVLREKGSTGGVYTNKQIADHMNDGVDQAYSYGEGRNFRERMLCCFDMRATNAGADVVFSPLRKKADGLGVYLRYWFLYRSSKHWRSCTTYAALNGGQTPPNPR